MVASKFSSIQLDLPIAKKYSSLISSLLTKSYNFCSFSSFELLFRIFKFKNSD